MENVWLVIRQKIHVWLVIPFFLELMIQPIKNALVFQNISIQMMIFVKNVTIHVLNAVIRIQMVVLSVTPLVIVRMMDQADVNA